MCGPASYSGDMSNETKARSVRIPDALWDEAKAIAERRFETLTEVIRRALVDYVETNR